MMEQVRETGKRKRRVRKSRAQTKQEKQKTPSIMVLVWPIDRSNHFQIGLVHALTKAMQCCDRTHLDLSYVISTEHDTAHRLRWLANQRAISERQPTPILPKQIVQVGLKEALGPKKREAPACRGGFECSRARFCPQRGWGPPPRSTFGLNRPSSAPTRQPNLCCWR